MTLTRVRRLFLNNYLLLTVQMKVMKHLENVLLLYIYIYIYVYIYIKILSQKRHVLY